MAPWCIFLLAFVLVPNGARAKDDKNDSDKLQGEWLVYSMELAGRTMTDEDLKRSKLVVKGDDWLHTIKSGELKMTFKVDPVATPKEIDFKWTEPGGKDWSLKGIYKLDGNTLTVCKRNQDNEDRPKEFRAGATTLLEVFKRAEKK